MSLFIVFEGITGSGKKTHIRLLKEELEKLRFKVATISFPSYETSIGRITKQDLDAYTLSLIFAADRLRARKEIENLLKEGVIVISDRYCYSNFAYQGAKGVDINWLKEVERFCVKPDLVFLVDVPVEISISRVQQAKIEDYLTKVRLVERLKKERENLEKVRENYLRLARGDKEVEWVVIDGTKSIEENHRTIWKIVKEKLSLSVSKPSN